MLTVEALEARYLPSAATVPVSIYDTNNDVMIRRQEEDQAQLRRAPVVVLGDSILDDLERTSAAAWYGSLAPLGALDLAVAGGTTNHVLWKVNRGEVAATGAQVVVLMVGVNNFVAGHSPADVADGIRFIIQSIEAFNPEARFLLLGILPAFSPTHPLWTGGREVNARLATLRDPRVTFADIGTAFTTPSGTINSALIRDGIHPSAAGYQVLANLITPVVRELLYQGSRLTGRLFRDLLQRNAEANSHDFWTTQLNNGLPRSAMAGNLATSEEYRVRAVDEAYRRNLGRSPDQDGRNYWVGQLGAGMSVDLLTIYLQGSEEFRQLFRDDATWLDAIYVRRFARVADAAGRDFWLGLMHQGADRLGVVYALASTSAAGEQRIHTVFYTFLGRHARVEEVATLLARGAITEDVLLTSLASDDYFRRAAFAA